MARHLLSIILTVLILTNVFAQAQDRAFSRDEFKAILERQSTPSELSTDFAGSWANVYQYLLPARFIDPTAYENAARNLVGSDSTCSLLASDAAKLNCVFNEAADVTSHLQLFEDSFLYRQDAVAQAERDAARDPGRLVDTLILLALDELNHGSLSNASAATERALEIMSKRADLRSSQRLFRTSALNARLADSRLDDDTAQRSMLIALDNAPAGYKIFGGEDRVVDAPLVEILSRQVRGQFCATCDRLLSLYSARWMERVLSGAVRREPGDRFVVDANYLLLAFEAPDGWFTKRQLISFSERFIEGTTEQTSIPDAQVRRILRIGGGTLLARSLAIASKLGDGGVANGLNFLFEKDAGKQARLGQTLLTATIEQMIEMGGDSAIVPTLYTLAQQMDKAGFKNASLITFQKLIDHLELGPGARRTVSETTKRQSILIVSALNRLAEFQLRAGNYKAAHHLLHRAHSVAVAKLRDEWVSGGDGTLLTIRDLSPGLSDTSELRHELNVPTKTAAVLLDADILFKGMQLAMFGETALTIELANRRKLLSTSELAGLWNERNFASSAASRMKAIEDRYSKLNVGRALTRERLQWEQRHDSLNRDLKKLIPTIDEGSSGIDLISVSSARSTLEEGEALIMLHSGRKSIDGFILDRYSRSSAWRSPVTPQQLEEMVKSLRAAGRLSQDNSDFPFDVAEKLFKLIFEPVKGSLRRYRKLVIVADGALQSLPYAILLTKKPPRHPQSIGDFAAAGLPWMVRSYAIAISPSVKSFTTQRASRTGSLASLPFLGVGNPILATTPGAKRNLDFATAFSSTRVPLADVAVLKTLTSLPETEAELRAIARSLGGLDSDVYVQERATETKIKSLELHRYRIIAFATHGALAGEVRGTSEPGLILTPPSVGTMQDDGFLGLSEILSLRFDADLVILSACNTARPDGRPRAEGLSGLARGFFGAGARSLVVTHWAIPSESAVSISTGLFAAREKDRKADWSQALRKSMLAVMEDSKNPHWAHPAFWGAFTVVGVMPAESK